MISVGRLPVVIYTERMLNCRSSKCTMAKQKVAFQIGVQINRDAGEAATLGHLTARSIRGIALLHCIR